MARGKPRERRLLTTLVVRLPAVGGGTTIVRTFRTGEKGTLMRPNLIALIAVAGGLSLATAAIAQPPSPTPGAPATRPSDPATTSAPDDKSSADPSKDAASPNSPRTNSDTSASAPAPATDDAAPMPGSKDKKKSKHTPVAPSDTPSTAKPH